MSNEQSIINNNLKKDYEYGFVVLSILSWLLLVLNGIMVRKWCYEPHMGSYTDYYNIY